ncbi:hypothetical protein D5085_13830 [Ectothiorhodospiraceae bacterium BW-2]|nr:hypothetical protein D5085_13830 [Ectothiorhodospiraceae bacterium BW-2]
MEQSAAGAYEQILEQACQAGCEQVRWMITQLEQRQLPELFAPLTIEQQRQILGELKQIMRVYD